MKTIAGQPNPFGSVELPPLITRPSDYLDEEEDGNSRENGSSGGLGSAGQQQPSATQTLVESFAAQLPLTQVGSIPLQIILSDKIDETLINETVSR